jgi:predicted DNA-binding transcriptional regulator YafY
MRASRLVELLLHLQVRGQASCGELARRLEVSERTVQRDVEALVAAGVPVRTMRGPAGGYRLEGGYRTRLTGVGAEEAAALSFLGLAGPAGELGLAGVLDVARTKVWAALTGEARERAQRSAERFHLDPVRWYGTPEPTPCLAELADAVWHDRRVRIRHVRAGTVVERTVDPLGLVLAAGDWYLVGLRRSDGTNGTDGIEDGERRTYRVSRIRAVELLDERAHRPAAFALGPTWAQARRDLERRHDLVEVTIRVDAAALPRLRRSVAVAGQERVDVTVADGRVELTVPFEGESWACTVLLGLGAAVEVLAPAPLRARIAEQLRAAAARYEPRSIKDKPGLMKID